VPRLTASWYPDRAMTAGVFLDRDNTIIHNDDDLGDPEQVRLIQGAASAISSLCGLGYRVIVVSNQGGVARGKFTEADVDAVNERLRELVQQAANGARIDRFSYCPFHPEGKVAKYTREHYTRKPQPGMLTDAAEELGLDLAQSWTIGDQMRDIEAGATAGTRTILLCDPEGGPVPDSQAQQREPGSPVRPNYVARNLIEACRIIAQARKPEHAEDKPRIQPAAGRRWDADAIAHIQHQPVDTKADQPAPPAPETPTEPASPPPTPYDNPTHPHAAAADPAPTPHQPSFPEAAPHATDATSSPDATASTGTTADSSTAAPQQSAATPQTSPTATSDTPPEPHADKTATPEPASPSPEPDDPADNNNQPDRLATNQRLLRLILQELRHQTGQTTNVSTLTIVAIVLQMIAALCLLAGLWMGTRSDAYFLRWIATGLITQLATIAMLLFDRK